MCSCQIKGLGRKNSKKMAKKKSSRRRRSSVRGLNQKDFQGMATGALIGAIGAVLAKKILENVLPAEYAQHLNYAQVGTGILLSLATKNAMAISAGLGAATVGLSNVVEDLADGQMAGLGLIPPGKNYNPALYPGMKNSPGIAPL